MRSRSPLLAPPTSRSTLLYTGLLYHRPLDVKQPPYFCCHFVTETVSYGNSDRRGGASPSLLFYFCRVDRKSSCGSPHPIPDMESKGKNYRVIQACPTERNGACEQRQWYTHAMTVYENVHISLEHEARSRYHESRTRTRPPSIPTIIFCGSS